MRNSASVFVALGIGLALPGDSRYLRPSLIASIVVSALLWYFAQAFGMVFSGMATDFNSGLLLIVTALGVWRRQMAGEIAPRHSLSSAAGEVGQRSLSGDSEIISSWS